jgi:hypothetical protein
MLDIIADILGELFGKKSKEETTRNKLGVWTILLLLLVILMGIYSIYYLVKLVISP